MELELNDFDVYCARVCDEANRVCNSVRQASLQDSRRPPISIPFGGLNEVCERANQLCDNVLQPLPKCMQYSPARYPPPGEITDAQRGHPCYEPWMGLGYKRGAGDGSLMEKRTWFEDPLTFEFPTRSRPYKALHYSGFLDEQGRKHNASIMDANIEKLVSWRSVHGYCKEVTYANRMVVGVLSYPDWEWYIQVHLDRNGKYKSNFRKRTLPNHGKKHAFDIHRITWKGEEIPRLYNEFWYYKKYQVGRLRCRSLVSSFSLVRHDWTGAVYVEFTYDTWCWDDINKKWKLF